MKKRVFAVLLAAIMLVGAMPFALAEDDRADHAEPARVSAYCPACTLTLSYRYYGITRTGSGKMCYIEEAYEQPYCNQHGNVYGARLIYSHEFYHDWDTDDFSGNAKCKSCGVSNLMRSADIDCENAPTFHRWNTNYLSGYPQCSLCKLISVKPPVGEETVCPNYKTFHRWVTNKYTGNPMCANCEHTIGVEIAG